MTPEPLSRRQFLSGALLAAAALPSLARSTPGNRLRAPHADIGYLSAAQLSAAYAAGTLSPVEVTRALIERIAVLNPLLNAYFAVSDEQALSQARAAERRWRKGAPLSALDGVPISFKDHMSVEGTPSPGGRAPAARLAILDSQDEPVVENLRAAGAVLLAKSCQPELFFWSSGVSRLYGPTRNPWDTALTPGGSSAGAGAAAAAGLGPIHLGSDSGSSIRGPASYCGVIGLKTSAFRVPQLDSDYRGVIGPVTRTPLDAAMALTAMARINKRDPNQIAPAVSDYTAGFAADPLRGKRIAFCPWIGDIAPRASGEVLAPIRNLVAELRRAAYPIDEVGPFAPPGMWDALAKVAVGGYGKWAQDEYSAEEMDALHPVHRQCIEVAARLPAKRIEQCEALVQRSLQTAKSPLDEYDLLLLPTMPGLPQEAALPWPDYAHVDDELMLAYDHLYYSAIFNLLRNPAISVNCAFSRGGLPIGLQIAGKLGDDHGVLRAAHHLSSLFPSQQPWPAR